MEIIFPFGFRLNGHALSCCCVVKPGQTRLCCLFRSLVLGFSMCRGFELQLWQCTFPHGKWDLRSLKGSCQKKTLEKNSLKWGSKTLWASGSAIWETWKNQLFLGLSFHMIKRGVWKTISWTTVSQFHSQWFGVWNILEATGKVPN